MEGFRKKQAHAEAIYEQMKSRPTHKTGILGLCGPRVDSIDYYKEEKEKQAAALKDEQILTQSKLQKGSAIVFFNSRAAATSAGQVKKKTFLLICLLSVPSSFDWMHAFLYVLPCDGVCFNVQNQHIQFAVLGFLIGYVIS
mgnify:CR=1 FL=1